jgi:EAL domain-containing protein (putative c-di-GMP-specific phosphodiesterase class I)/ActR/RegA family two-component response regulator
VKRLLVLDDDPDMCALVVSAATSAGYQAISSTNFGGFTASLTPETSVVVLDLMMPEVDGIQVLRYLSSQHYASDIVLISGYDKKVLKVAGQLAEALGLSIRASVQKPVNLKSLREILTKRRDTKQASPTGLRGSDSSADPESLRRAIADDQLLVHYQPQYYVKTRKLAGMEALVRWQHPAMGILPAAAFIEAFETSGLIEELTWLVIRKVLADKKVWGSRNGNIAVSLNISTRSLRDLSLPEKLLSVIADHGGQPSDFILEITESGLIKELHTALDVLARMRLKGFGLSIDDFGTGYATMQQLQRVPARELKLDMSFTQSMLHDESANIIVKKTLELAHDLDMHVVAEGVETKEQLRALAKYGCEVAQGHWLGAPGPIEALPRG